MKALKPISAGLILLALVLGGLNLSAQTTTMSAEEMPTNEYMVFDANKSLFYYSDVGYQQDSQAVLLAANADAGGSMMYTTLNHPVYIVGLSDKVYIDDDLGNLEAQLSGQEITTTTNYEVQINSPSNDPSANLSAVILQLKQNPSDTRFMYVGGIGISVIQDVDPNTFQGIQIPNGQVFSLETITTISGSCNGTGNHALLIKW